jgi:Sec-independent protein translocase protein TatA
MLAASRGELVLVAFIFALVWGAGVLPRVAAQLAARGKAKANANAAATGDGKPDRG